MPSQILSADAPQRCVKYPEEAYGFGMEFSKLLVPQSQNNAAETISSITSITITPSGTGNDPVVTGQTIAGSQVQFKLAGGMAGTTYKVAVIVLTSLGYTREGKGRLVVVN